MGVRTSTNPIEVVKPSNSAAAYFHNRCFHPDLPYSLSAADVHWVAHKPEFEGLLFPSKFYGIAAVGRGVIAITSSQSELAKLVSGYQCGVVIEQLMGKPLRSH